MKLVHSPSIAPSSATSFDATICPSKNATAACWFAGILRRILCSQSLPTHPSDQIQVISSTLHVNANRKECVKSNKKIEGIDSSPGIVARLMGLDSLPGTNPVSMQINSNSIARTGYMNSLEFGSLSDEVEEHRERVSSTLSFRDIPASVELEDEYIVLSFEKGDNKKKKVRPKVRKCKPNSREKGRVDKEFEVSAKATIDLVVACEKQNVDLQKTIRIPDGEIHVGVAEGEQLGKKNGEQKINVHGLESEEPGSCSENSSPVSVLNFDQFDIDPKVPTSEEATVSKESSSRWRLASKYNGFSYDQNLKSGVETSSSKGTYPSQNYLSPWGEICRLAGSEVVGLNWVEKTSIHHQDLVDVNADLGLQILYELIEEAVDTFA